MKLKKLVTNQSSQKSLSWVQNNIVPLLFVGFTILGFICAQGSIPFSWFLSELSTRFFRNAFLVLSLVIPIIAGLGLNFGIIVGAMSGQLAIVFVRYFYIEGTGGILLCFLLATPVAMLCGYLTGKLYNKTRGQETIASLIVGFFANGIYQFILLFVVGVIIPVPATHPIIKMDGVGVRMTVDMGSLKASLEQIWLAPFMWVILFVALLALFFVYLRYFSKTRFALHEGENTNKKKSYLYLGLAVLLVLVAIVSLITENSLTMVRRVPMLVLLPVLALCLYTWLIMKTKLGQDFRSVGQSQHIALSNGINVDRTRIIAVVMSTVLAGWGQIIYVQNMGTLNTYNAHTQIGMFSVAAILVGGATVAKATVTQALIGTLLFHSMFIMSPEIGRVIFGQPLLGEYFRTFMVYFVIGIALGLYVWKENKKNKLALTFDTPLSSDKG
jgi:simple sugar transport system permease protein